MSKNYLPIGAYFQIQNGFAFPSSSFVEDGIPIIRMSDLKKGRIKLENPKYVDKKKLSSFTPFILKDGDFLLGMSGSLSNYALVFKENEPALLNQRVGKLTQKETSADYKYVCFWLKSQSYIRYANIQGEGAAQKNISSKQIEAFKFWNAPLLEQKKISLILTSIEATIEKTEALIHKYQQIKQGLMHDLFTRGVTPDGKVRPSKEQAPELYKKTRIGWIPLAWNVDHFGKKVSIIDPNPSHRYPNETEYGVPICSTETFLGTDKFNLKNSKYVSEQTFVEQNIHCLFSPEDVIFARKGKIGLARRYGVDKKVFSHTVVVLKPGNKEVIPAWLLWMARSYWLLKSIMVAMNTNLGVPTLGVGFIQEVQVPFPKPSEQLLMAQMLDGISKKIDSENNFLEKLNRQKFGLMQDLLTGKVRVTVDQEEPVHV